MVKDKNYNNNCNDIKIGKTGLQNLNANYYAYTPPCNTNKTIILKWLDGSDDEDQILWVLKEKKLENVKFIKKKIINRK